MDGLSRTATLFVGRPPATVAPALDRAAHRSFLPHIHRLRAIAILCIVAVHCTGAYQWHDHPRTAAFLRELFDNSTVLFLFVGGFLFQHLSKGYSYESYLRKKAAHVLLPYLVIATPGVLLALHYRSDLYAAHPALQHHTLAYVVGWLYFNGGATINVALWFVPVILLFYLAAPLFIQFERHPRLYGLLWVLLPLSLLAHRPVFNGGHNFEFLVYFLSAYVFGMYCSRLGPRAVTLARRHLPWLLAAYVGILLGHTFFAQQHGLEQVPHLFSFENGLIDWLFLQKILLGLILLALLSRLNDRQWWLGDYLAEVSFTIYFVHMYFLYLLQREANHPVIEGNVFYVTLLLVGLVGASCAVSITARRFLGGRSRTLVGS